MSFFDMIKSYISRSIGECGIVLLHQSKVTWSTKTFQTGLNSNPSQHFGAYNTQMPSQPWYNPNPYPWIVQDPWQYQGQPIPSPYQAFSSAIILHKDGGPKIFNNQH
jgi:hypothetical protein